MNARQTAGRRHPGDDQTYARAHVEEVKRQFPRIGHHLDSLDRDLTEYCHYCKEPLELDELVRDVGQRLADKPVTLTRRLAQRAILPAKLVAWHVTRPVYVQDLIDALAAQIRDLEAQYPIDLIKVRDLVNGPGQRVNAQWHEYLPGDWWTNRLALHRAHHAVCPRAIKATYPANVAALAAYRRSGTYLPPAAAQLMLGNQGDGAT